MFNIYVAEKMMEFQKEKLRKIDRNGWQYKSSNDFKSLASLFTKLSQSFKQPNTHCCSCHSC